MPNRLIRETSPYLLQHAHNPVDWYPWGEEALEKAVREDKPILVSIGYAACHWCHVMEKESFEDEDTAALMNEWFVNIKIDREERPDLDHIYMEAVQAISGSGGWPLNVFLTPDKKPFYGGTYFPPTAMYNRASWQDVLKAIHQAFTEKRQEIEQQAVSLTQHIEASNHFGLQKGDGRLPTSEEIALMCDNVLKTADTLYGGFGRAPKFPQTFTIRFLLHHYYFTGDRKALQQACLSLDKMIQGGINDQTGGGFARYSTDEMWLVPHFEKMLYDNALLVIAMAEAFQATEEERYLTAIRETLDFVERELVSPEHGFYAALDADSEGEEGKFYVWTKNEITTLLGEDAELFCAYYDITERGNWEHRNIPRVLTPPEVFADTRQMDLSQLRSILDRCRHILLRARSKRVRPATDDKILLGWNAMMNTACCKAFAVTGDEKYRQTAVSHMAFLLDTFSAGQEEEYYHTYKNGVARYPAFLDDYAQLIQALLTLQEITGNQDYLKKVKTLVKWVILHFGDTETDYFYFTNAGQQDVVVRKKELYDGAVPSGNSLMAWNLYVCGVLFDEPEWIGRAVSMCAGMKEMVIKYPGSFGIWAMVMQAVSGGIPEIAVTGAGSDIILKELLRIFIPLGIIQSSPSEIKGFPLLAGKSFSSVPMIWLCKNYSCQSPVNEVSAFKKQLGRVDKIS